MGLEKKKKGREEKICYLIYKAGEEDFCYVFYFHNGLKRGERYLIIAFRLGKGHLNNITFC